jgi:hypothetical protein
MKITLILIKLLHPATGNNTTFWEFFDLLFPLPAYYGMKETIPANFADARAAGTLVQAFLF